MKIEETFPPNIEAIAAVFPAALKTKGALFCYGGTIHNPFKLAVPHFIVAHEEVHSERQGGDPAAWWDRYLADPEFRLAEELIAHRREYAAACAGGGRNQRRHYLKEIASRLSGPFYGKLLTFDKAKRLIQAAA